MVRTHALVLASLIALAAGCANNPPASSQTYSSTPAYRSHYEEGRVTAIEVVRGSGPSSSVAGAVVGGIIGGVLGHQVGSGRGNDAATVVGAVGGAVIGNEVGKSNAGNGPDTYRVTLRLANGDTRAYEQATIDNLRVGDRVALEDGRLVRF
jgi:outer membrane lipoprotein SlyB